MTVHIENTEPPEHLYQKFKKLQDKAWESHDHLPLAINFFNERIAGLLRTKESWLQTLSMIMVYSDIFLDELPKEETHWELSSSATSSLLREQDNQISPQLAGRYRLAKEEYGKGGKESLGMKAQFWVPVDPSSTEANIIVFRGTCLALSVKSAKKNLGTGMAMNMDSDGFGRTAFEDFWPIFGGWVEETRDSGRKLIATGHSLGEFFDDVTVAIYSYCEYRWCHCTSASYPKL